MNRYIADLHFGHKNILLYDNRPFDSVEEMDEALIESWNKTVKPTDTTYLLGDIVWSYKYENWTKILSRLNGKKFVIKGNHDSTEILNLLKEYNYIEGWSHQEIVQDNNRHVVLNHSPMPFFVNMHKNDWYHLYGHVHISFDYQIIQSVRGSIEDLYQHEHRMFNVGCMIPGIDYAPKTLSEIVAADKKFKDLKLDYQKIHDNQPKSK